MLGGYEYKIEIGSWALIVREIERTYDHKDNKIFYHEHTLPCLLDDDFCEFIALTPFLIVCFSEELCLILAIHSSIGRMPELSNRYCLETNTSLVTITPIFLLKHLMITLNLKPIPLVLKYSPKVNLFAMNPHLFTRLKNRIY